MHPLFAVPNKPPSHAESTLFVYLSKRAADLTYKTTHLAYHAVAYFFGLVDGPSKSKQLRTWSDFRDYLPTLTKTALSTLPIPAVFPTLNKQYHSDLVRIVARALNELEPSGNKQSPPLNYMVYIGSIDGHIKHYIVASSGSTSDKLIITIDIFGTGHPSVTTSNGAVMIHDGANIMCLFKHHSKSTGPCNTTYGDACPFSGTGILTINKLDTELRRRQVIVQDDIRPTVLVTSQHAIPRLLPSIPQLLDGRFLRLDYVIKLADKEQVFRGLPLYSTTADITSYPAKYTKKRIPWFINKLIETHRIDILRKNLLFLDAMLCHLRVFAGGSPFPSPERIPPGITTRSDFWMLENIQYVICTTLLSEVIEHTDFLHECFCMCANYSMGIHMCNTIAPPEQLHTQSFSSVGNDSIVVKHLKLPAIWADVTQVMQHIFWTKHAIDSLTCLSMPSVDDLCYPVCNILAVYMCSVVDNRLISHTSKIINHKLSAHSVSLYYNILLDALAIRSYVSIMRAKHHQSFLAKAHMTGICTIVDNDDTTMQQKLAQISANIISVEKIPQAIRDRQQVLNMAIVYYKTTLTSVLKFAYSSQTSDTSRWIVLTTPRLLYAIQFISARISLPNATVPLPFAEILASSHKTINTHANSIVDHIISVWTYLLSIQPLFPISQDGDAPLSLSIDENVATALICITMYIEELLWIFKTNTLSPFSKGKQCIFLE